MSFSPQLFLSNIKAKDGLARPSRYEVILPIPKYIGDFIQINGICYEIIRQCGSLTELWDCNGIFVSCNDCASNGGNVDTC